MVTSNKKEPEVKYFIIQRGHLSEYGNEHGSDKAEAERLLGESSDDVGDLVVIRGIIIKPYFNLE